MRLAAAVNDQALFDEYAAWHAAKGYWPNETPLGRIEGVVMPAVGGFVFDSAGTPADREIRVYRRDTGALLGKTRSSGGDGDPHFDKVSLLLPCDGDEGSKLITDSSLGQKPMTVTGAASIAKTVTSFGRGCLKFTGSAGAVSTLRTAAYSLGAGTLL